MLLRKLACAALVSLSIPACGGARPPTPTAAVPGDTEAKLDAAIHGQQRPAAEAARDPHRHPKETLLFFGLRQDMRVVELSAGGGWYTSILAPVLKERGHLAVTMSDPDGDPASESTRYAKQLKARMAERPDVYGAVETLIVKRGEPWVLGPDGSADMVLTFRSLHGWIEGGVLPQVLASAHAVLKPGGVLGVVQHRAKPGAPSDLKTVGDTGYVPEDAAIAAIAAAGFKLEAKSEINHNPRDTKDYPKGVWTLPPTYELGDKDRGKYEAIGESDRMTLRFVKK